jgi:hypothetical protein
MSQWTRGIRARPSHAFDGFRRVSVDVSSQLLPLHSGSSMIIDTTDHSMSTLRFPVRSFFGPCSCVFSDGILRGGRVNEDDRATGHFPPNSSGGFA